MNNFDATTPLTAFLKHGGMDFSESIIYCLVRKCYSIFGKYNLIKKRSD